jgi:hypothetical protein
MDWIDCQRGTSLRWSSSKRTLASSVAVKAGGTTADGNGNLAKASRCLNIDPASLTSEQLMTNSRRRFTSSIRHAMLHRGLVALLLPLGLLFLAFVSHG